MSLMSIKQGKDLFIIYEDVTFPFLNLNLNISIRFIGNVINRCKEGFGINYLENNYTITSYFTDNKANGFTLVKDELDKIIYKGIFLHNKPSGYGKFFDILNDIIFEGTFTDSLMNGIGIKVWSDDSFYKGEFLNGKKNGLGVYCNKKLGTYYGEFKDDKFEGYVIII